MWGRHIALQHLAQSAGLRQKSVKARMRRTYEAEQMMTNRRGGLRRLISSIFQRGSSKE